MFGNHGLCGLLEEGAHEKSPKCLGGNLGDFGEFCKGLGKNVDFTLLPLRMPNSDGLNIQDYLKFSTTDRLRWLHRLHHP